ncbi:MAG: ATP-dependent DNA helicase [Candidatus Heimdallarchaeota archaeon AB_125]|nr:MAG: ATP-dependent DNA helicase [Candidatus Heimdallarchaeota archaeon AB_125]
MQSKTIIQMSIRNLVEYVLRKGDISLGFFSQSRLVEGTKAHQKIQNSRGKGYQKEVSITDEIVREEAILSLRGRIDGVFEKEGKTFIEEIKSTSQNLATLSDKSNENYWAQAKFYAFLYAKKHNLDVVNVQLTYYQIDTKQVKYFVEQMSFNELEEFCLVIIDQYLEWAVILSDWLKIRSQSIDGLNFPFPTYRKGQEKMVKIVEEVLSKEKTFFCQAPTGIGKTIGALYPSIKLLERNFDSKIFYLTAKTTTRFIAEETLEILRSAGLKLKSTTITAKAKICFKEKDMCDPNYCEYARGHFNRINGAIKDIFQEDAFTREIIEKYAKKHRVCPFEFSLDLTLWSDCVVCDYNYAFDPRVFLKRFFAEENGEYTFLIDEAHNLVDRARKMFSAGLLKKPVLSLRRKVKEEIPELSKILNKINQYFIKIRKKCETSEFRYIAQKELPEEELFKLLRKFSSIASDWLELNIPTEYRDELLELFFDVRNFLRTAEDYDDHYVTYYRKYRNNVIVKLFCMDPSKLLKKAINRGKTAIFYSATLSPIDYFAYLLGGGDESTKMQLPSPFPRENLALLLADHISTRYVDREQSYKEIADLILKVTLPKIGNYLIYFPSYEYLENVLEAFESIRNDSELIVQTQGMTEEEREGFLDKFSKFGTKTLIGFAVMGGIFGEGIDLIGEKLSGAVVVGVGLPKISLEQDLIKDHFDTVKGKGFLYAYTFPGMNKVMQAAGRVIRTEKDQGVVLLIGDRYSTSTYTKLFPESWQDVRLINNKNQLSKMIESFWEE